MAWEWSHTMAAYKNARDNLATFDDEQLAAVYAEWRAMVPRENSEPDLHLGQYRFALIGARSKIRRGMRDLLEDVVYGHMAEQSTCDNGGFDAWACPFGCHTVSFDKGE